MITFRSIISSALLLLGLVSSSSLTSATAAALASVDADDLPLASTADFSVRGTRTGVRRHLEDGKGKGKTDGGKKGKSSKSPVAPSGTIADIACSTPSFSTLCALVVAAGLGDDLSSPGPFTVFAPTNEAFANFLNAAGIALPPNLADIPADLLQTITNILLYHVVSGAVLKANLVCNGQVVTLLGTDSQTQCLNVGMGEQSFFQIGDATLPLLPPQIVVFDIPASNGVIHVVNNVILP
jgi:uncharacterized surface protein with fasciclin (FAS1) repeats